MMIFKRFTMFLLIFCLLILSGCGEHIHIYTKNVVNPTSTALGYDYYICNCGDNYEDNYTCLLTFESLNYIDNDNELPQIDNQIIPMSSEFNGVEDKDGYTAVEYRIDNIETDYENIFIGQKIEQSITIQVVLDEIDREKTLIEQNFENLLQKIKKLEELSIEYNEIYNSQKNPILRALQYIKKQKYNGFSWNLIAGDVESNFVEFVNEKDSSISSLQTIDNIVIPKTNEEVDFVHMVALMNVAYKSQSYNYTDLAGWLGDICQLSAQIDKINLSTDVEIYDKCEELFNASQGSGLSSYDLIADLDGLNIINFHNKRNHISLYDTMKEYYTIINTDKRKINFINNTLDGNTNKKELIKTTKSRLYENLLIKTWCNNNGLDLSLEKSKKIVNKLIELMIDYLIND